MLTNEQVRQSEECRAKWAANDEYQILVNDLKDTVLRLRNAQEDRIRESNRVGKKADGKKQKNVEDRQREVSETQKKLAQDSIEKLQELEDSWKDRAAELVKKHPGYKFLRNVKGCSTVLSSVIMSQLDPIKIDYVSSFYSFCGCCIGHDRLIKGQKANFNKWLKSKMLGVAAEEFKKCKSQYALYYYSRMIFLMNRENAEIVSGQKVSYFGKKLKPEDEAAGKKPRCSLLHLCRMANRHMIQKFLRDYYCAVRTEMGMPVIDGYAQEKLGLQHSAEEDLTNWKFISEIASKKEFDAYKEIFHKQIAELRSRVEDLKTLYGYNSKEAKKAAKEEEKSDEEVNSSEE